MSSPFQNLQISHFPQLPRPNSTPSMRSFGTLGSVAPAGTPPQSLSSSSSMESFPYSPEGAPVMYQVPSFDPSGHITGPIGYSSLNRMQSPDTVAQTIQNAMQRHYNVVVENFPNVATPAQSRPELRDSEPKHQTGAFRPVQMTSPDSMQSTSFTIQDQTPAEQNRDDHDVFKTSVSSPENMIQGAAKGENTVI